MVSDERFTHMCRVIEERRDAVTQSVSDRLPEWTATLAQLVKIPSVSWSAFDRANVKASASFVADRLRGLGLFDTVMIREVETDAGVGQPAVLASRAARNGAPSVLLYAHHDVQPEGAEEDWDSAPYEPTLRDGRLYGRGAADDKAGVVTHLAALSILAAQGDPDLGIAVFIEGEEENGSSSFPALLDEQHDLLAADAIVVADSGNWSTTVPGLTIALRGAVAFNVTVKTLDHAVHSGMFGGASPDALMAAIRLADSFWAEDGSVAVRGLETRELASYPDYDEDQLREESGLSAGVHLIGSGPVLSRLWAQPSITVTGIDAPAVAVASNTLIPRVRFRVSARIAPGQPAATAFEALRAHVLEHVPFGASVTISDVDLGESFRAGEESLYLSTMNRALATGWGASAVQMGGGGSIPFIALLTDRFPQAQVLVTAVEDPDTRAHSPNESVDLEVFRRSIVSEALFLLALDGDRVSTMAER